MRVIKKSEVRKIIIGHVELTLIFLFDYLLCKIAILESLKVLFLDKQVKPGFTNYQPRGLLILNFTILKKNIQNISKSFRQNQTIKNKVNK